MISNIPMKMVKEFHMTATITKNQEWWFDCYAPIHVHHNKNMIKTYSEVKNFEKKSRWTTILQSKLEKNTLKMV